jgi:hypothetical protein
MGEDDSPAEAAVVLDGIVRSTVRSARPGIGEFRMIRPKAITLFYHPAKAYVSGEIVTLTDAMVRERIHGAWWNHVDLKGEFEAPQPIDLHWHWNDVGIEYEGRYLPSEAVAAIAGEGDAVQGVMLISSEPVPSILEPDERALFVERLFTAPWNRPNLRRDGRPYLLGVGTELITWGAWFSREKGYGGRLLLDGSPAEVDWYTKRGLQTLDLKPMLYEGVNYTPMELSPGAAEKLLGKWEAH